jgi:D-alanyl-lipoteichoic acid acyltransferase DltB (MBOAT superfamily)
MSDDEFRSADRRAMAYSRDCAADRNFPLYVYADCFPLDTFRGAAATLRVTDYFLFVAYFPHLVAGPIIHHAQTIPQFRRMERDTWDATDVAVGPSILTIGLFKKLVIADSVAPFARCGLRARRGRTRCDDR